MTTRAEIVEQAIEDLRTDLEDRYEVMEAQLIQDMEQRFTYVLAGALYRTFGPRTFDIRIFGLRHGLRENKSMELGGTD